MRIREAILKAADHIEMNPTLFKFFKARVPDCGTPGCALGWIAHFRGYKANSVILLGEAIDGDADAFYRRMRDLAGAEWAFNAAVCAQGLRLYADKYHPEESKALVVYRPGADIVRDFLHGEAA